MSKPTWSSKLKPELTDQLEARAGNGKWTFDTALPVGDNYNKLLKLVPDVASCSFSLNKRQWLTSISDSLNPVTSKQEDAPNPYYNDYDMDDKPTAVDKSAEYNKIAADARANLDRLIGV